MKTKALLLLCGLSIGIVGCQDNQPAQTAQPASQVSGTQQTASATVSPAASATASETAKAERYTVGIDIGSPPFSTKNENGDATGFEVEILQAIADSQNFSVSFIGEKRATLYSDMENGKYQIMVASLEVNPDNLAKFEMTQPHAKSYRAILSRKDKPVASAADLLKNGSVGVQENTASAKLLKDAGADVKEFPGLLANFQAFMRKETDFMVGNAVPLSYYLKQYKDDASIENIQMTAYDSPAKINDIAFAVNKNNAELVGRINAGLQTIQSNGTYDRIYEKWFGSDDIAKVNLKK